MLCNNCDALGYEGYEYPEPYCGAGVPEECQYENRYGDLGCRLHKKTIEKRLREEKEAFERMCASGEMI